MKNKNKYLKPFQLLLAIIFLSACSQASEDNSPISLSTSEEESETISLQEEAETTPPDLIASVQADEVDLSVYNEIDSIDKALIQINETEKSDDAKTFTVHGTTSNNCSKIIVKAYDFQGNNIDTYELTTYEYGDTEFKYRISEVNKNLENGVNKYLFTAYCDGEQEVKTNKKLTYFKPYEHTKFEYTPTEFNYEPKTFEPRTIEEFNSDYELNTPISEGFTIDTPSYSNGSIESSDDNYYINSDGEQIQSPTYYDSKPAGATATCSDGTYSFSQHKSGTCSGHGGIAN